MSSAFNIPAGYWLAPMEPDKAMWEKTYGNNPIDHYKQMRDSWINRHPAPPVDAVPGEPVDAETWAELYRLREAVKGPKGFATWQDAAVDERHRRVKAEAALAASVAMPVEPVAWVDSRELGRLHESGLLRIDAWREDFLNTRQPLFAAPVASRAGSEPTPTDRSGVAALPTTPPVGECTRSGHPAECEADPKVGCVRWRLAP